MREALVHATAPDLGCETDPICSNRLPEGTKQLTFNDLVSGKRVMLEPIDLIALRVDGNLFLAKRVASDAQADTITVEYANGLRDIFERASRHLLPVASSYFAHSLSEESLATPFNPIARTLTSEERATWERTSLAGVDVNSAVVPA
jgi:hypothetical protein